MCPLAPESVSAGVIDTLAIVKTSYVSPSKRLEVLEIVLNRRPLAKLRVVKHRRPEKMMMIRRPPPIHVHNRRRSYS